MTLDWDLAVVRGVIDKGLLPTDPQIYNHWGVINSGKLCAKPPCHSGRSRDIFGTPWMTDRPPMLSTRPLSNRRLEARPTPPPDDQSNDSILLSHTPVENQTVTPVDGSVASPLFLWKLRPKMPSPKTRELVKVKTIPYLIWQLTVCLQSNLGPQMTWLARLSMSPTRCLKMILLTVV